MKTKANASTPRSAISVSGKPLRSGMTYSLISMVVGLIVVVFIGLGNPAIYSPIQFAFGALYGLFISTGAWVFEYLLLNASRGRLPHLPTRLLGFFLGGGVGHLLAYSVTGLLLEDPNWDESSVFFRTFLFAVFASIVGLVFYAFEVLKRNLRERELALRRSEVAAKLAESELEIARSIQQRLLPPPEASGPGYRLSARNVAAQVVAGDFYDVFREGDHSLCVVVGDVAGKGVGASLIMASVKAVLPLMAADRSVADTLTELNQKLFEELDRREFVALALARFDLDSGRILLANAGLPDPFVLRAGRPLEAVEVSGPRLPLGARAGTIYEQVALSLQPGNSLLLYSDGLPEARQGDRELGYEAFAQLVARVSAAQTDWLDAILDAVGSSREVDDDRTLLALERPPTSTAASVEVAGS